jgi:hypothetical protein
MDEMDAYSNSPEELGRGAAEAAHEKTHKT